MSWEENVRKVVPYVAGEQPKNPDIIKLNTNECPYSPAPGVLKALADFRYDSLRLYPDTEGGELSKALAEYYHVSPKQVFVGVGSDDVIAQCFMTFFNSDKPILFPDITYSFYDVWADLFKIPFKTLALKDDFSINIDDYCNNENGGIIIPNPNAPTGLFAPLSEIEKIIKANPNSVVIIDEAYVDFGGESALSLLPKYDNLLIVQTFSKSRSMAGLRVGFAIGSEKMIKYLSDVKFSYNSYTMNMPSLVLGVEAVKDDKYFKETVAKVVNTRENTKVALKELGFDFPDSKSNFIFARHKSVQAKEIFEKLKERNIYVRYFNKPRIDNYLRISIGTDAQMEKLIEVLKEILV